MTKITITATLTDEYIQALAKIKGYSETIIVPQETTNDLGETQISQVETQNPQSSYDYIRQVYEGIIIWDATREFLNFSRQQKEEQEKKEHEIISENVKNAITSQVENE